MKPILSTLKLLIVALCLFSLNFNPQQGLSVGQSAYAATYVAPPRQAVVTHIPKLARLNAFELAIRALVGVSVETVSWVMDEKNTSVRWKRPLSSVGDPEGEKHCRRIAKERGFEYGMTERVEFDGKLAYFKCFNPYLNSYGSYSPELEGVLTFSQIADQMIVNAVTGNKDSQNALDIVKRAMAQANAPKPPLKPSVVVTQPKPTSANPPKDETKPDVKPKPPTTPKQPPKKKDDKDKQEEEKKRCKPKIDQIDRQAKVVKDRYYLLLLDEHSLHSQHKKKSNSHPKHGSWDGHIWQYGKQQRVLDSYIIQLKFTECEKYVSDNAKKWRDEKAPTQPNRKLANQNGYFPKKR